MATASARSASHVHGLFLPSRTSGTRLPLPARRQKRGPRCGYIGLVDPAPRSCGFRPMPEGRRSPPDPSNTHVARVAQRSAARSAGEGDSADEIVARCRQGEREAFRLLYERYQSKVYSVAFQEDAYMRLRVASSVQSAIATLATAGHPAAVFRGAVLRGDGASIGLFGGNGGLPAQPGAPDSGRGDSRTYVALPGRGA